MTKLLATLSFTIRAFVGLLAALNYWQPAAVAGDATTEVPHRPTTAAERDHWAYRPIVDREPPPVSAERLARHPIDRFVGAALEKESVAAMPRAGRTTLARRLFFDLVGLPPAPAELAVFLDDRSDDAYAKLVERLLASPAYGERWAQHWLDLARFAETDGFEHDLLRPNAWRYRDWVIDALNRDLPFDDFVRLQLAGDILRPDDPQAAIATGFLLCGPDMPDLNLQDERRHQVLNEMAATVGSVFLGLQVGCAQCHDHKYDPIRQRDFYRLRAFFESADIFSDHPIPTAEELAARRAAEAATDPEVQRRTVRRDELEELGRARFRDKNPDEKPSTKQLVAELNDNEKDEYQSLVAELCKAKKLPELSQGRVMREGQPRNGHFYYRGDFRQRGPAVTCGFPEVLASESTEANSAAERSEHPRALLAEWLVARDNPLVARVMVNRLWQWHFGSGLASTPSDVGVMGSQPTHPELLDWLARRFVESGWSIKAMHRLLVTSETYQMASGPTDREWSAETLAAARDTWQQSNVRDPQNQLLGHRRRTRLDAETIRDSLLAAGGGLSPRRGGPGIRAPLAPEVMATLLKDQWVVSDNTEDHRRRGIYLFVRRNLRYPLFDVFDRPDTNASCPQRHESTTATQALTMFNSYFSLACAHRLAGALMTDAPESLDRRIEAAYQRLFGRSPNDDEALHAQRFLERQEASLRAEGRSVESLVVVDAPGATDNPFASAALVDLCVALFNANEFLYVD